VHNEGLVHTVFFSFKNQDGRTVAILKTF